MERIVFHIDVNNAFLSWTAIDLLNKGYDKDVRNYVAVVGGDEKNRNGIVLAKSAPAKKLGIVTGDTLYSVRRKCPDVLVFPPNHKFYQMKSDSLFSLLSSYTPDIEIASIDECYLDYSGVKRLYGDEFDFALMLKEKIKKELGFTVNIGIANNKLCAKMASDFSKPDKIHTLYDYEIEKKMYPLVIDDLFGIGKSTAKKLHDIGIHTIGSLANCDPFVLKRIFKNRAVDMINRAKGISDELVNSSNDVPKGISNEITLSEDVNDINLLNNYLYILSQFISERLLNLDKYGTVVAVILKDSNFSRKNHQKRLKNPINSTDDIYNISVLLLKEMYKGEDIRLIGLRIDSFSDDLNYQYSLFDNNDNDGIDEVINNINKKYGKNAVKRASYVDLKK